jgi:stage V sporulation protein B
MIKQSFIHGTMILLAAGIINRLLGFVPRIALPRMIGAEGVGIYQLGYPFLLVLLTIITGGIPLAVAKLVAEAESVHDEYKGKQILYISLGITLLFSILITLLMLLGAHLLASEVLGDERVYYTLLAMSPMLCIVGISSVYRGYFQGRLNMLPTATSQIVETIVRILAMLLLAYMFLPRGIEVAAAGAMLGVTVGEVIGLIVLIVYYVRTRSKVNITSRSKKDNYNIFKKLLAISTPVTGSRLVGSSSYFLESVMTMKALAIAGMATAAATTMYGTLQGMVIPILLLPGVLTYSLSVSLIPSLSEAAARNDRTMIHKRLHQSLRLALVSGAPFAILMYILAEPITYYLYHDAEVGHMLKSMAPVALFLYFQGPLQAALQALDRPGTALLNTFYGAAIKLILIYLLATQPQYGIYGVLAAINANIVLVTLLHWYSVTQFVKISFPLLDWFKTAIASISAGVLAHYLFIIDWHPSPLLRFLLAGIGAIILYVALIYGMGLIDEDDFGKISFGNNKNKHKK